MGSDAMTENQLTLPGIERPPIEKKSRKRKKTRYDWVLGEEPPLLGRHSLAKHKVLQAYLEKYVRVLTVNRAQEQLKLTLVDGFAGGGAYRHPDTGERLAGSPVIMLQAMEAAGIEANEARRKPFSLDVEYVFIEKQSPTIEFLRNELQQTEAARNQDRSYSIVPGSFSQNLDAVFKRVEQRGRSRRVIFLLDQYGFTDVCMTDLQTIFRRLPNAEVILTIAIDWLIDHWTESARYDSVLSDMGLSLESSLASHAKDESPNDWRAVIQHELHEQIFRHSGATYYTPFFIHSVDSHRAYWLLHFSGHAKARDVMTQLHWELENQFQHFGRPGLQMLGYDPRRDLTEIGQRTFTFGHSSIAAVETHEALVAELPHRLVCARDGITLQNLFQTIVNETPATKDMVAEAIRALTLEKELEVRTRDGVLRQNGVHIKDNDYIIRPRQRLLLPRQPR